jgi:hypothetical protein
MQELKEQAGIVGTVIIRSHPAGTIDRYNELRASGRIDDAQRLIKAGKVEVEQKNLVVYSLNYGYDIIVQFLLSAYTGSFAFPLGIAWGEIGTGSTTPTNIDIALTTPTNRTSVSYGADIGFNEAQLQFFFPDAVLANGTYYEFGTFIGGTSSIGSGNMFNHALFSSPYSKSAGSDSTIEVDFLLT